MPQPLYLNYSRRAEQNLRPDGGTPLAKLPGKRHENGGALCVTK
jgi:hypothetical protein